MIQKVYSIVNNMLELWQISKRQGTPSSLEQRTIAIMGNKRIFISGSKIYTTYFNQN